MTDSVLFRKLKIALICDWFLPQMGGTEMHMRDLADRLSEEGHEVHVITPIPGSEKGEKFRIHRLNAPILPYARCVYTRSAFKKIECILKKEAFDIVHCHCNIVSPTSYGSLYLSQKLGIPAVITWDSIIGPYRWGLALLNWVFKWSRWPVLFSGVSEVVVRDVASLVKNQAVTVLPNALNVCEWKVTPVERDRQEVWIVSVMRLFRKKRGKALVGLLPNVIKRLPENIRIKVKIIGEGPKRTALEKQIKRLGLENIVELPGYRSRDEIRKLFSRTDIYVQPTRWESFGIAALEARSAGVPVVAKVWGGVKGFIRSGKEGFLARTDQELEDHLVRLILEPELRESIARNNRETEPPFDWKEVIKLHEAVYQKAMRMRRDSTG
jgi:glycosyltransferase involved in cell wall biosynthesis